MRVLFFLLLFSSATSSSAQFLIGESKSEVLDWIFDNVEEWEYKGQGVNKNGNFYYNAQVRLGIMYVSFIFNTNDVCDHILIFEHTSNVDKTIKRFNEVYIPDGENKWKSYVNGYKTRISLTIEDSEMIVISMYKV